MRKWDKYGTHLEKGDGVKGGEGGVYKYKVYRQKKNAIQIFIQYVHKNK